MASTSIVFLLLFTSFVGGRAVPKQSSHIALGSSLSPIIQPTSWLSPSQKFAFGFYRQGSGFAIGIWLVSGDNTTVVWTAIRDHPPFASNAMLVFTEDGKLLLRTERGQEKLFANATDSASHASMLDSGNFVLYDKDSKIIWQSFYFPTDTILGGQTLFAGHQLLSGLTENDHSTGRFHLKMQDDGNLVLYPVNTGDTPGDAYWNTQTFGHGSKFHLYLNNTGSLFIVNGTTLNIVYGLNKDSSSASNQNNTIYRATLDFDGIFRLYSHVYDESGYFKVSKLWSALDDPCHVKSICGFNSFCTMNDDKPYCICLPGTDFVDVNRNSLGCFRNFSEAGCSVGTENASFYDITTVENLVWGDRPYVVSSMSIEECSRSCLEDCDCGAALFKIDSCMKQKLPLRYVRRDMKEGYTALLKVGMRSIKSDNPVMEKPPVIVITSKRAIVEIFLVSLGCTVLSCVALAVSGLFIFKSRVLWYKRLLENGNFGLDEEVTLRLFSYNELKRATNGFKEQLGKGSFGAVYKGAPYKGKRLVAVKRLEKLVEEEREFHAVMRAIGRTHHRNLVRLLGYCAEDSKRLLVYEYMSNGSLADHLFNAQTSPNWNERVRIAQDIARGILYLHEECEASIIHCDIKPQNILMDDFWTAKISDFGLAKFLMEDQTRTFTGARGTREYLAPEWQKNMPISVKADVYSYGIVLLEIVCCRRNVELDVSNEEEVILSTWIYKCFVARELHKILRGEEADKTTVENMVKVALWCIQDEPALRPTMKSVVLMLEGITEVSIPPCPATMSV